MGQMRPSGFDSPHDCSAAFASCLFENNQYLKSTYRDSFHRMFCGCPQLLMGFPDMTIRHLAAGALFAFFLSKTKASV
jgi:hypothetical protein